MKFSDDPMDYQDLFDNLWMRGFRGLDFNAELGRVLLQRGLPVSLIEELLPDGRDFDAWESLASMDGWYDEVYQSDYDHMDIRHYLSTGNLAMVEYVKKQMRDSGKTNEQRFQEDLKEHGWKLVDMGCPGVYVWANNQLYHGFTKAEVWEQLPS